MSERRADWPQEELLALLVQQATVPLDPSLTPLLSFVAALPGARPGSEQISHPVRGRRHILASDLRQALGAPSATAPSSPPSGDGAAAWEVTGIGLPAALAGAHQDWVEVNPSALQLWERQALGPYSYAKNVSWLALAPPELATSAELFFRSLDQTYSACNFGRHETASLELEERWVPEAGGRSEGGGGQWEDIRLSRVVEVPVGGKEEEDRGVPSREGGAGRRGLEPPNYGVDDFLRGLRKAFAGVQQALWRNGGPKFRRVFPADGSWLCEDHDGGEHFFVVYVVCPFDSPDAYAEVMAEALRLVAPVTSPWLVSPLVQTGHSTASIACPTLLERGFTSRAQGRARHVERLRSVSALQMLSRFAVADAAERFVRGTALSVYHKLRRPEEIKSWPGRAPLPSTPLPGTPASPGQYTIGSKGSPATPADEKPEPSGKRIDEAVRNLELMHEPAFILAHPYPPSQNPYKDLAPDDRAAGGAARYAPGAPPLQHWVHCCYSIAPAFRGGGSPWLLAAWTDSRGELLETHAVPLGTAAGGRGGGVAEGQQEASVSYPALCSKILSSAAQIVSSALKASREEVDLRHVAVVRLGDMEEDEREQWQRVLSGGGDGSSAAGARGGDGEAYGLTSIAVGSMTAEAPVDLDLWVPTGSAPGHLLQLGPQAVEGPGRLQRGDSAAPGGGFVWIAWTPSTGGTGSQAPLLPGEDLWARVSRFSLVGQRGRGPGISTPAPETPATPATPSDGSSGGAGSGKAATEPPLPRTLGAELHNLAACSAAFHGLVTGCGDRWWRSNPKWRAVHGDSAHLPLHCKVVENMHLLLGALGPLMASPPNIDT